MTEQLISFETAKMAKEKGFDIPVLDCYNENQEIGDIEDYHLVNFNQWVTVKGSNTNMYSAPTQSVLQKWLREKHNIHIEILLDQTSYPKFAVEIYKFIEISSFKKCDREEWFLYRTYEEALEEGLQEALKLIK